MTVKRTIYDGCAGCWLWTVDVTRDSGSGYALHIVAESVSAAADEALAVMRQELPRDAGYYRVVSVKMRYPIHGAARAPSEGKETT